MLNLVYLKQLCFVFLLSKPWKNNQYHRNPGLVELHGYYHEIHEKCESNSKELEKLLTDDPFFTSWIYDQNEILKIESMTDDRSMKRAQYLHYIQNATTLLCKYGYMTLKLERYHKTDDNQFTTPGEFVDKFLCESIVEPITNPSNKTGKDDLDMKEVESFEASGDTTTNQFACDICSETFDVEIDLTLHLQIHEKAIPH
ncbi:hypothetical protein RFI_26644 [Reticulomyxa filosa]|uniref:C2H2-type domain-containing protein n=1 Tax=Reticulomyxa filosa TaxID=46433 RepID=X6MA12_RETFI|nr:hypothetical protein RFI_26644 [Reticulomyxa filosa]|eukprot:ETO10734.1 hypothetical protein RFI_26644 [Reticulomyxa filosa]